jgi:hypothetical protein
MRRDWSPSIAGAPEAASQSSLANQHLNFAVRRLRFIRQFFSGVPRLADFP